MCVQITAHRPACGHDEFFSHRCASEFCQGVSKSSTNTILEFCSLCFLFPDPRLLQISGEPYHGPDLFRDLIVQDGNLVAQDEVVAELVFRRAADSPAFQQLIRIAANSDSKELIGGQVGELHRYIEILTQDIWNRIIDQDFSDALLHERWLVIQLDKIWIRNFLLTMQEHQERQPPAIEIESFPEEEKACFICLESFEESGEYPVKTACGHTFGSNCISKWSADANSCPVCRTDIVKKKQEEAPAGGITSAGAIWVDGEGVVLFALEENVPAWLSKF